MSDVLKLSFTPEIEEKLQYYVYRLIDPRTKQTFYVGKGKGNRVFAHIRDELKEDPKAEGMSLKLETIREIREAKQEVQHIIHRHGLEDENEAFHVEAALIDAYIELKHIDSDQRLTNKVLGHGSNDVGPMDVRDVIAKFSAKEAEIIHKAILINVNHSQSYRDKKELNYYEPTRFSWKISKSRAEKAEIVLAVVKGVIRDAFVAEQWLPATTENFPGYPNQPDRCGFIGRRVEDESIRDQYVGKRVPDGFYKKGSANPIRYTF